MAVTVDQFVSGVWKIGGLTPSDTPEIAVSASSSPVGRHAIDLDNARIWEVSFDQTANLHVWQLVSSLSGQGQVTIDFGTSQSQRASVAVPAPLILANAIALARLGYGPTPDHSEDEHLMASTVMGVVAGSIVPGVGFTVYATTQANMSGQFTIEYSWRNP